MKKAVRDDLLALTPEAVAALANRGLMKRALKDIEAGRGPQLEEREDGTVIGLFADGTSARLPVGVGLAAATCSCAAPPGKPCRHRVAVALAYADFAPRSKCEIGDTAHGETSHGETSPGDITDLQLEDFLPRQSFRRALRQRKTGQMVEIRRAGQATSESVPTARLPTCTVRFLVPGELAWARCDCKSEGGCQHLALAVWAFRQADDSDQKAAKPLSERTVEVKEPTAESAVTGPTARLKNTAPREALEDALSLTHGVLLEGVTQASQALAARFERARRALLDGGSVWPATALSELEAQLDAYRRRSSLYRASSAARLVAELTARARAVTREGELPARHILGQGEAPETALRHLALTGLGARFLVDGQRLIGRFLLGDANTATVLVLTRTWNVNENDVSENTAPPSAAEFGRRSFAGSNLLNLASGQVVSQSAKRQANRSLTLGRSRGQTTIMPQIGDWKKLPKPLRVEHVEELETLHAARPPRFLRPHILAENVHVVAISEIGGVVYDPAGQTVVGQAFDTGGSPFTIALTHRAVAPNALDVLASALSSELTPSWVAGEVTRRAGVIEVEPTALVCGENVVVPDISGPAERPELGTVPIEDQGAPVERALAGAMSLVEEGAHRGLRRLPTSWPGRARQAAEALRNLGMAGCAERLRQAADHIDGAISGAGGGGENEILVVKAWNDAAIRLILAQEQT